MNDQSLPARAGTILVVDDTPENLHLLREILVERGYKVRVAIDGDFVLRSVCTTPPDLILLDVKMPGLSGYEICRQLKADARSQAIPVIFLSALGSLEDKVNGFKVGGVDYITKPFQPEEVLARVQTHLTIHALQHELRQENARRAQAEEELQLLNQQLRAANASKDTFFSIIAHDLRSPFTTLIGLTEVLSEEFDRFDARQVKTMLNRLHDSSKQLFALLTNLLDWSRLQRGVLEYCPQPVNVGSLLVRNMKLLRVKAEQKQIALVRVFSEDIVAYADQSMLDTVLRNLLSNALKFTPPGGTITIAATATAQTVNIVVTDTGVGIAAQDLPKLFRIDTKCVRPGTNDEQGTGLGLILCKEFVERQNGTLAIESIVGTGTTVTVTLPLPEENHHGVKSGLCSPHAEA